MMKGGFEISEGGIKHPVGNGRTLIGPLRKQHQARNRTFPQG